MVVPTIHGYTVNGVDNTGKNRVVREFAASRPGTQVPEWAGFVHTHPEEMFDELHPNEEGSDARAQLIAQGVLACLGGVATSAATPPRRQSRPVEPRLAPVGAMEQPPGAAWSARSAWNWAGSWWWRWPEPRSWPRRLSAVSTR